MVTRIRFSDSTSKRKFAVASLLSQVCCRKFAVASLLSQVCCRKFAVASLLSPSYKQDQAARLPYSIH